MSGLLVIAFFASYLVVFWLGRWAERMFPVVSGGIMRRVRELLTTADRVTMSEFRYNVPPPLVSNFRHHNVYSPNRTTKYTWWPGGFEPNSQKSQFFRAGYYLGDPWQPDGDPLWIMGDLGINDLIVNDEFGDRLPFEHCDPSYYDGQGLDPHDKRLRKMQHN